MVLVLSIRLGGLFLMELRAQTGWVQVGPRGLVQLMMLPMHWPKSGLITIKVYYHMFPVQSGRSVALFLMELCAQTGWVQVGPRGLVQLMMIPMHWPKSGSITIKVYYHMFPPPSGRSVALFLMELCAQTGWVQVGPRGLVQLMMIPMHWPKSGSITIKLYYHMFPVPSGRSVAQFLMELCAQTGWVQVGTRGLVWLRMPLLHWPKSGSTTIKVYYCMVPVPSSRSVALFLMELCAQTGWVQVGPRGLVWLRMLPMHWPKSGSATIKVYYHMFPVQSGRSVALFLMELCAQTGWVQVGLRGLVWLRMPLLHWPKSGSITIKVYYHMFPVPSSRSVALFLMELCAQTGWVRVAPRGLVWLRMLLLHWPKSGSITIKVYYQMVPVPSSRSVAQFLMELCAQTGWVRVAPRGLVWLRMLLLHWPKSGSITIKTGWVRVGPRGLVWLRMPLLHWPKSGSITVKVYYQMVPVPSSRSVAQFLMELCAQTGLVQVGTRGLVWLRMLMMHWPKSGSITIKVYYCKVPVPSSRSVALFLMELCSQTGWVQVGPRGLVWLRMLMMHWPKSGSATIKVYYHMFPVQSGRSVALFLMELCAQTGWVQVGPRGLVWLRMLMMHWPKSGSATIKVYYHMFPVQSDRLGPSGAERLGLAENATNALARMAPLPSRSVAQFLMELCAQTGLVQVGTRGLVWLRMLMMHWPKSGSTTIKVYYCMVPVPSSRSVALFLMELCAQTGWVRVAPRGLVWLRMLLLHWPKSGSITIKVYYCMVPVQAVDGVRSKLGPRGLVWLRMLLLHWPKSGSTTIKVYYHMFPVPSGRSVALFLMELCAQTGWVRVAPRGLVWLRMLPMHWPESGSITIKVYYHMFPVQSDGFGPSGDERLGLAEDANDALAHIWLHYHQAQFLMELCAQTGWVQVGPRGLVRLMMLPMHWPESGSITIKTGWVQVGPRGLVRLMMLPMHWPESGSATIKVYYCWVRVGPRGLVQLRMPLLHWPKSGSITVKVYYQMVPVPSSRSVAQFLMELCAQTGLVQVGTRGLVWLRMPLLHWPKSGSTTIKVYYCMVPVPSSRSVALFLMELCAQTGWVQVGPRGLVWLRMLPMHWPKSGSATIKVYYHMFPVQSGRSVALFLMELCAQTGWVQVGLRGLVWLRMPLLHWPKSGSITIKVYYHMFPVPSSRSVALFLMELCAQTGWVRVAPRGLVWLRMLLLHWPKSGSITIKVYYCMVPVPSDRLGPSGAERLGLAENATNALARMAPLPSRSVALFLKELCAQTGSVQVWTRGLVWLRMLMMHWPTSGSTTIKVYYCMVPVQSGRSVAQFLMELCAQTGWVQVGPRGLVRLMMLPMHWPESGSITIKVYYCMVPVSSGRSVALFRMELCAQTGWVQVGPRGLVRLMMLPMHWPESGSATIKVYYCMFPPPSGRSVAQFLMELCAQTGWVQVGPRGLVQLMMLPMHWPKSGSATIKVYYHMFPVPSSRSVALFLMELCAQTGLVQVGTRGLVWLRMLMMHWPKSGSITIKVYYCKVPVPSSRSVALFLMELCAQTGWVQVGPRGLVWLRMLMMHWPKSGSATIKVYYHMFPVQSGRSVALFLMELCAQTGWVQVGPRGLVWLRMLLMHWPKSGSATIRVYYHMFPVQSGSVAQFLMELCAQTGWVQVGPRGLVRLMMLPMHWPESGSITIKTGSVQVGTRGLVWLRMPLLHWPKSGSTTIKVYYCMVPVPSSRSVALFLMELCAQTGWVQVGPRGLVWLRMLMMHWPKSGSATIKVYYHMFPVQSGRSVALFLMELCAQTGWVQVGPRGLVWLRMLMMHWPKSGSATIKVYYHMFPVQSDRLGPSGAERLGLAENATNALARMAPLPSRSVAQFLMELCAQTGLVQVGTRGLVWLRMLMMHWPKSGSTTIKVYYCMVPVPSSRSVALFLMELCAQTGWVRVAPRGLVWLRMLLLHWPKSGSITIKVYYCMVPVPSSRSVALFLMELCAQTGWVQVGPRGLVWLRMLLLHWPKSGSTTIKVYYCMVPVPSSRSVALFLMELCAQTGWVRVAPRGLVWLRMLPMHWPESGSITIKVYYHMFPVQSGRSVALFLMELCAQTGSVQVGTRGLVWLRMLMMHWPKSGSTTIKVYYCMVPVPSSRSVALFLMELCAQTGWVRVAPRGLVWLRMLLLHWPKSGSITIKVYYCMVPVPSSRSVALFLMELCAQTGWVQVGPRGLVWLRMLLLHWPKSGSTTIKVYYCMVPVPSSRSVALFLMELCAQTGWVRVGPRGLVWLRMLPMHWPKSGSATIKVYYHMFPVQSGRSVALFLMELCAQTGWVQVGLRGLVWLRMPLLHWPKSGSITIKVYYHMFPVPSSRSVALFLMELCAQTGWVRVAPRGLVWLRMLLLHWPKSGSITIKVYYCMVPVPSDRLGPSGAERLGLAENATNALARMAPLPSRSVALFRMELCAQTGSVQVRLRGLVQLMMLPMHWPKSGSTTIKVYYCMVPVPSGILSYVPCAKR
ncbi:uncharacterized protein RHOBADRAFT_50395 [Rhodotorula graminis WP1]|uniref:Uncharacterized protein n=1 Tax=Rhodotorula graminis (strain WP1) TaxID=578459 RepID=A0A0P9GFL1_RHOGW|nr:uncharacterized protein RHOBADRAFT_50395 [Rhodotorula graminis WP1]KPV71593.1 hypothetical protein RHOBADRAFT_50395 [Rhodotorula graminis WP1]